MPKFTVVISDVSNHDAGYRKSRAYWWLASLAGGYAELCLYWFLLEYFGSDSVQLIRPSELLGRSRRVQTDYLMVGVPTRLGKQHLEGVQFREMVLYDSSDHDGINYLYSDQAFLQSVTDRCLKHYRDERWSMPLRIGLLPIKRPPLNNRLHWKLLSQRRRATTPLAERRYDVGFVARPTGDTTSNLRLRWWIELVQKAPELRRWGGLVGGDDWRQAFAESQVPDACWMKRRKIGFSEYFDGMQDSKVALAPPGYAPWSFRHYEAIYAGCMIVTADLSPFEFLIPMPEESVVQLSEGESVVDGVRRALALGRDEPQRLMLARKQLDQWLKLGLYSRHCGDTLNRFMAFLEC